MSKDSSTDNKGVSIEGPSITSIPKEGSSIAKRSKEPIPKELLEWYGYDTVEDYLPVAKKPITKVIFKSPIPIKGCVLGLANVETWDNIVKKFRMRTPEICADKSKGKRKNHLVEIQADDHDLLVNSDNENDDMLGYESENYSDDEDADETNHAKDADGTNHSDLKLVKRGITRLYKFRKEYSNPGGIKIKRYFNVDLTVRKLEKSARGKMGRSKNVYHHKIGRGRYVFVKEKMIKNKETEADEEPPHGIMWLKGRVNKDEKYTDDEIRLVGDKLKEADDKIKEGTLNLEDGTDTMTVVFGKEKEGYARGVGSGVTYKRNQLAAQEVQLNLSSQLQVASDVTPMGAYEVDGTQPSVVVRDKDARIQKKSNGLVTSEKEPVKTVGPKKTPKSRRNGSQDSQSQGNVSPTQELPTI
nr:hypothetical protein [Tanacetum cinerariifolium]